MKGPPGRSVARAPYQSAAMLHNIRQERAVCITMHVCVYYVSCRLPDSLLRVRRCASKNFSAQHWA